jgi:hypothetical protein
VLHDRILFALAVWERRPAINISTADDVYFGRGNIFRGLEGGERAEAICFSLTAVWLFGLTFSFISGSRRIIFPSTAAKRCTSASQKCLSRRIISYNVAVRRRNEMFPNYSVDSEGSTL